MHPLLQAVYCIFQCHFHYILNASSESHLHENKQCILYMPNQGSLWLFLNLLGGLHSIFTIPRAFLVENTEVLDFRNQIPPSGVVLSLSVNLNRDFIALSSKSLGTIMRLSGIKLSLNTY